MKGGVCGAVFSRGIFVRVHAADRGGRGVVRKKQKLKHRKEGKANGYVYGCVNKNDRRLFLGGSRCRNLSLLRHEAPTEQEKVMVKITSPEHLQFVRDEAVRPYIQNLLETLLREYSGYCPGSSIERIGAIFVLEAESDWNSYRQMELFAPITSEQFEWIISASDSYRNGCIVLDNDRAINIIGKEKYFMQFKEAFS